jgi:hypothetical protein
MLHCFDPVVAEQFGVDEAILIQNMRFWIHHNQTNGTHFYEGRYWTYNSHKAFAEQFPYWSFKQVRRIIDKLKQVGAIMVGTFNQVSWDRTQWYTLRDDLLIPMREDDAKKGNMHLPKWANGSAEKGKWSYITDVNTDKGASAETGASAPSPTPKSEPPKTPDVKKSVVTIADLVAEGVSEEHARDWIKARGKKSLTPTAWKRLKSDAAKHGGTPAQAVQICAEKGWQGLDHDGAAKAFAGIKTTTDPKQWQPEDPNKICISPTGEKWFMGRRVT